MTEPTQIEGMLKAIVSAICRKTRTPKIQWASIELMYALQVDGEDHGRMVGKKGLVYWAISTLLWYAGLAQITHVVSFKLHEPETSQKDRKNLPFELNPNWDKEPIRKLLEAICVVCLKGSDNASWVIEDGEDGEATVRFRIQEYLKQPMTEPNFEKALGIVIKQAGLAGGAAIETEVSWN